MLYIKHTIIPLVLCFCIYILFRTKVFLIIDQRFMTTLYFITRDIQSYFEFLKDILPEWFLYSLPDGLWSYAFTSYFVIRLHFDENSLGKICYLVFCPLLSIIFELGQNYYIFPGTFDYTDLWLQVMGSILPFVIINHKSNYIIYSLRYYWNYGSY